MGFFGWLAAPQANFAEGGADDTTGGDADGSSDTPYSSTNLQEEGVDESDIVKNDGQNIYVLRGNIIHVIQALPADAVSEVATIELDGQGDSLYLREGKLVALTQRWSWYHPWTGSGGAEVDATVSVEASDILVGGDDNDGAESTVTVIDVSNPAAPVIEATIKFEGSLASSRLIANRLYLVLATTPRLPPNPIPLLINAMPLDEWIPDYETTAADGTVVASGDIGSWQDFYRPDYPDGYSIVTVVTVDVDAPTSPFKTTAISADAGTIYASTEALYVTDTDYDYSSGSSRTDTAIHKLSFTQDGTAYRGTGLVPGRLLSQYSLGEYQGYLRVATTVEEFNNGDARLDNNVYVLKESGSEDATLPVVGKIEGIAPGEQIYAARFLGNRGFLVTFRRVDPLYTLDLTDPAAPVIVGELKVPGFSDHIQLLDENHLLTIGKDAQDAGNFAWIQGLQLSIFDVTDPANPTLLHKELIGGRGTSSEANQNPKAFNYYPERQALAFPADVYGTSSGGPTWGRHEFTGLYVYRVTVENGFEFLGRISSSEGTNAGGCFLYYYGFTRGVFIGDTVYSVTERNVKAADLSAVEATLGEAPLTGAPAMIQDCYWYGGGAELVDFGEGVR